MIYCVAKCKKHTEDVNIRETKDNKGKPRLEAQCGTCGKLKSRFIPKVK